jgi:excisionase family DNA binding protein
MVLKKKSPKRSRHASNVMGFSLESLLNTKEEAAGLKDELLTVTQAAEIRGTSRIAIHELITRGRLKAVEIAGRKFIRRSELEAFEKQKPGPKMEE